MNIKFLNLKNIQSFLYSLTYASLVCAPNNIGLKASNYTMISFKFFFIIFFILFFFLIINENFKKKIKHFFYFILFLVLFDFVKIKYDLFSYSNLLISVFGSDVFVIYLKENIIYLFFILFIFFLIVFKYDFIGLASKFVVLFFAPYIIFFMASNIFHIFQENKFISKIEKIKSTQNINYKKKLIVIFDELDNKILSDNLHLLPGFSNLILKSNYYKKIIVPGLETLDTLPNLFVFNNINPSKINNKKFKDQKYYLNFFENIKNSKNSMINILNNNNNELFIFGYFHKFCKLLLGSYGDCYEFKYIKNLNYRNYIKNIEILETHRKNYQMIFNLTDYFFYNPDLKSGIFHIPLPHWPYMYSQKNNKFMLTNDTEDGYLGNLIILDKYVQYLLIKQKEFKYDLIAMSDHGLRDDYKNHKGVSKLTPDERIGRAFLAIKKYSNNDKKIINTKEYMGKIILESLK